MSFFVSDGGFNAFSDKNGTVHTINIPVNTSRIFPSSTNGQTHNPPPMHGHRFSFPRGGQGSVYSPADFNSRGRRGDGN